jgi:hypothetical protein
LRAAARLKALHNNVPKRGYADRQHVEEYDGSLDYLEAADHGVAEFRIQDSWLNREVLAEWLHSLPSACPVAAPRPTKDNLRRHAAKEAVEM